MTSNTLRILSGLLIWLTLAGVAGSLQVSKSELSSLKLIKADSVADVFELSSARPTRQLLQEDDPTGDFKAKHDASVGPKTNRKEVSTKKRIPTSPIIFVQYHKTGHAFTKQLIEYLIQHNVSRVGLRDKWIRYFRRTNNKLEENESVHCPHVEGLFTASLDTPQISRFAAPDFFCDGWIKTVPQRFKLVRFVRDPFEMCVSSYLYHHQSPTPEKWVNKVRPCEYNQKVLSYMAAKINMSMDVVYPVIDLCTSLMPSKDSNYYGRLRNLSREDGLRLEASRFIISQHNAGGDIMRMAANAVEFMTVADKSTVKTYYMSNFTSGKVKMKQSLTDLIKFSFQGTEYKSWVSKATRYMIQRYESEKLGTHVTTTSKNRHTTILEMIEQLKNDAALGPLLRNVGEVLRRNS